MLKSSFISKIVTFLYAVVSFIIFIISSLSSCLHFNPKITSFNSIPKSQIFIAIPLTGCVWANFRKLENKLFYLPFHIPKYHVW